MRIAEFDAAQAASDYVSAEAECFIDSVEETGSSRIALLILLMVREN